MPPSPSRRTIRYGPKGPDGVASLRSNMLAANAVEPAVEDEIGASVFVEQRFHVGNERWIVGGIRSRNASRSGLAEVECLSEKAPGVASSVRPPSSSCASQLRWRARRVPRANREARSTRTRRARPPLRRSRAHRKIDIPTRLRLTRLDASQIVERVIQGERSSAPVPASCNDSSKVTSNAPRRACRPRRRRAASTSTWRIARAAIRRKCAGDVRGDVRRLAQLEPCLVHQRGRAERRARITPFERLTRRRRSSS